MKLVCGKGRRVMVLDSGSVIHREDGSACFDKTLKLGIQTIYPDKGVVVAAVEHAVSSVEQWERENGEEGA